MKKTLTLNYFIIIDITCPGEPIAVFKSIQEVRNFLKKEGIYKDSFGNWHSDISVYLNNQKIEMDAFFCRNEVYVKKYYWADGSEIIFLTNGRLPA